MVTWTVKLVSGEAGRTAIRYERFATKREALALIRATPHSFIRRIGQNYTLYTKRAAK